jgi:hypothetical protein
MPKLMLLFLFAMLASGCSSLYFKDAKEERKFVRRVHAEFNTPMDPMVEQEYRRQEEEELQGKKK